MLRIYVRRSGDVRYYTDDQARELDGLRDGPAGWWLRGDGDPASAHDVSRVLTTTSRSQVMGYDLIFAAPRPYSTLLALDEAAAPHLVAAQRTSVRGAMAYLESRALVIRDRSAGGDREVSRAWERVVSFTHGVNRHGEPHLHDHVVVGARPANTSVVLDSRALYAHARAADGLYRASLRFEIARRTSYQAQRTFAGHDAIAGLDEGYRALWGGHHDVRGEKRYWERDEIRQRWRRDLERFEESGQRLARIAPPRTIDEHRFGASLEGRREVARRHVVEAWSDAAILGQAPREIEGCVNALYPEWRDERGVREKTLGVWQARQSALVRERGPRPLEMRELSAWVQRSREYSREGRSR
ncbi:MAG: relaxase domain-containing protein [Acidobacteriota bacterium]|nr:relaxase domain-containing protein [Acidobacteriota bacterium]